MAYLDLGLDDISSVGDAAAQNGGTEAPDKSEQMSADIMRVHAQAASLNDEAKDLVHRFRSAAAAEKLQQAAQLLVSSAPSLLQALEIVHANLSECYLNMEKCDLAVKSATACIKLNGNNWKALVRRAFAYERQRTHLEEARIDLNAALRVNPSCKQASDVLTRVEAEILRRQTVEEAAKQAEEVAKQAGRGRKEAERRRREDAGMTNAVDVVTYAGSIDIDLSYSERSFAGCETTYTETIKVSKGISPIPLSGARKMIGLKWFQTYVIDEPINSGKPFRALKTDPLKESELRSMLELPGAVVTHASDSEEDMYRTGAYKIFTMTGICQEHTIKLTWREEDRFD